MLFPELRSAVLDANLELVRRGLILYTFGNASGIDRQQGLVAIKPSGFPYERLTPANMVITDLQGNILDSTLRPSDGSKGRTADVHRPRVGCGPPALAHIFFELSTACA
jgi:L-ribulose-5-phosphate 4-epimerase